MWLRPISTWKFRVSTALNMPPSPVSFMEGQWKSQASGDVLSLILSPFAVVPTVVPSSAWEAHHLTTSYVQNVPSVCKGGCDRQQLSSHPILMPPFPSFPSLLPRILLLPPVILAISQKSRTCSLLGVSALPGCSLYLKSSSLGLHLASSPCWKLTLGSSSLATLS